MTGGCQKMGGGVFGGGEQPGGRARGRDPGRTRAGGEEICPRDGFLTLLVSAHEEEREGERAGVQLCKLSCYASELVGARRGGDLHRCLSGLGVAGKLSFPEGPSQAKSHFAH